MPILVWDCRGPQPFESSWSLIVKLLCWNVMYPTELFKLIERNDFPSRGKMLARFDSSWVDFEKFSAYLRVAPQRLQQGFLTELGFPVPKVSWAGVRHCPKCLESGYHSSMFDVVLLDSCPWHGGKLGQPCLACLDTIRVLPRHRRGRCPHIDQLLAPYGVRATQPLLSPALILSIEKLGQQLVEWWVKAGRADPDRNDLIADCSYESNGQYNNYDLFKLSYLVERAGAPSCSLRIPVIQCDYVRWLRFQQRRDTDPFFRINDDPGFRACYKSLRRHLQKRFIGKHIQCLRRMRDFEYRYSPVGLHAQVCRIGVFFLAWRRSHEIFSNHHFEGEPEENKYWEIVRIDPFDKDIRGALNFLYADFVRAIFQLCEAPEDTFFEVKECPRQQNRLNLLGCWQSHPSVVSSDCYVAQYTLVYPKKNPLLLAIENMKCPRRPRFELNERLVKELYDDRERRKFAVQLALDPKPAINAIYI